MIFEFISRRIRAFLSVLMIVGGSSLLFWSCGQLPNRPSLSSTVVRSESDPIGSSAADNSVGNGDVTEAPSPSPTPPPVVIGIENDLPPSLHHAIEQVAISDTTILTVPGTAVSVTLQLNESMTDGVPLFRTIFVPATHLAVVHPTISSQAVRDLWRGQPDDSVSYTQIAVLSDTLPSLITLLGPPSPAVYGYSNRDEIIDAVWATRSTLALLPFEQLTPEMAVLAVDGQIPIENDDDFDVADYPLVHTTYAHTTSQHEQNHAAIDKILAATGGSNRRGDRLTVIAMTGVTAMVRLTAQQMDQYGAVWPAEIVSASLASADITTVSNEVPFVPGCETNVDPNNLTFCSSPDYLAALQAIGTDIVGLTGNHQNDYGSENALKSLEIYAEAGLPVYGGGPNKEAAFAPLYMEHNGNRFAFLGANSYGPPFAWATDNGPGSAEFDLAIMSATIRSIKERDLADVVLAELQYQESYDVMPLYDQRQNFRSLVWAGADIVTGVQSHVPQAIELIEGKLILYGLGNLFFDQMLGTTREGLIVKHTIHENRHISTQILTTMIHDYGQPHWASESERDTILTRVFNASYWDRPR